MNGKMQLILNFSKKISGSRSIPVVIDACSINISDFLIKSALAKPDLPDFFKQMFKIVLAQKSTVFHAVLIKHIPFYCKFFQDPCCPLPELGGTK